MIIMIHVKRALNFSSFFFTPSFVLLRFYMIFIILRVDVVFSSVFCFCFLRTQPSEFRTASRVPASFPLFALHQKSKEYKSHFITFYQYRRCRCRRHASERTDTDITLVRPNGQFDEMKSSRMMYGQ